jgi:hypothetical protein
VQGGQEQQESSLGRGQRTGCIGGLPARRARPPITAPRGHLGLKGRLNRRDQGPQLLQGQTGQIQHRKRAGLERGDASMPHGSGLLSLEAQHIINRNKL